MKDLRVVLKGVVKDFVASDKKHDDALAKVCSVIYGRFLTTNLDNLVNRSPNSQRQHGQADEST